MSRLDDEVGVLAAVIYNAAQHSLRDEQEQNGEAAGAGGFQPVVPFAQAADAVQQAYREAAEAALVFMRNTIAMQHVGRLKAVHEQILALTLQRQRIAQEDDAVLEQQERQIAQQVGQMFLGFQLWYSRELRAYVLVPKHAEVPGNDEIE